MDDIKKEPTDSKEKVIKKLAQHKEKRDMRNASFVVPC